MRRECDAAAQDLGRESSRCRAAPRAVLGASRLEAGENRSERKTDRKTVRKTSPSPTEKPSDILVRYFLRTLSMAYEKRIELPNVSLSA